MQQENKVLRKNFKHIEEDYVDSTNESPRTENYGGQAQVDEHYSLNEKFKAMKEEWRREFCRS